MYKITKLIDAKNAALIGLVLLVAGYIGIWVPYQGSLKAPEPTNAAGDTEVVIKYTAQGFEPQTVHVAVGTTVEWSNMSGRPMWVASDPHPAHTDLKGFDQLRIINFKLPRLVERAEAHGDAIFKYTFTKPGTWKYHNHVYAQHQGTVIVDAPTSPK